MNLQGVPNPKRAFSTRYAKSDWYEYYAGYSIDFVKNIITRLNLRDDAIILDPWNGSGTTTQVAEELGFYAIGYDINPTMVLIAKARSLNGNCGRNLKSNLLSLGKNVLEASCNCKNIDLSFADPLEAWLMPGSSLVFRNIDRAIQQVIMGCDEYYPLRKQSDIGSISSVAAFFYTALFRTLRIFLLPFFTTNPTWIKLPFSLDCRLTLNPRDIYLIYNEQIQNMAKAFEQCNLDVEYTSRIAPRIEVASSDSLPLPNRYIDLVLSSPPYCTRIDYAIATRPELALLGYFMDSDIKEIRDSMIGTPTILRSKGHPFIIDEWGPTCKAFLNSVMSHRSKASKSYYLKYYLQYFDSIFRSLKEISRTLNNSAYCVLVVQDSYYKDIHNDLPAIFSEMGNSIGLDLLHRSAFVNTHSIAGINNRALKYRSKVEANECVLMFRNTA